jgi:8-oxo-dGTP pyrophosphatase MutT (NUDIX family)
VTHFEPVQFSLCFIFHADSVLLLLKSKPSSMAGLYNGIGGKREGAETMERCASREVFEEVGFDVKQDAWIDVCTMIFDMKDKRHDIDVFMLELDAEEPRPEPVGDGDELAMWFDVDDLPTNMVPNLRYLIEMCIAREEESATLSAPVITWSDKSAGNVRYH